MNILDLVRSDSTMYNWFTITFFWMSGSHTDNQNLSGTFAIDKGMEKKITALVNW